MNQFQDIQEKAAHLLARFEGQMLRYAEHYLNVISNIDVAKLTPDQRVEVVVEVFKQLALVQQFAGQYHDNNPEESLGSELNLEAAKHDLFERIRNLQRGSEY